MKQIYIAILLLLVCQLGLAGEKNILFAPSATIAGNATVCQNATGVLITFTGSGGVGIYTFNYTLNGVAQTPISTTGSSNVANVIVNTSAAGTFTYNLVSVQDNTGNQTLTLNPVTVTVISGFSVSAGANILVCRGNPINLTSNATGNGTNPVIYSWNGPNGYTSNQQSPTIATSTMAMAGNYTVTASIGNCQVQDIVTVTVAEPQLSSGQLIGSQFAVCLTNNSTTGDIGFTFAIPSYSSLISTYSIDWDNNGTYDVTYNSSNWNSFISQTFPVGTSNFSVKFVFISGCTVVKQYSVFVGSSPSPATMALFVNQATGCLPHTTQYTFNVPSTNVEGTTYVVSWGDGTPNETYIHPVSVATLTHIYNVSSCGHNVTLNSVTYYNVFQPTVVTQNPCSNPQPSGSGLISIGEGPTASFTPSNGNVSPLKICTNQVLQLTNTSNMGLTIPIANGATCSNNSPFYWTITPSTAGFWTATGLGSNNGQTNQLFWTVGSLSPTVTFNVPGTYTITLRVKNSCGDSSVSQTFCVEPPLSPSFTVNTNSGCIPLSVTTNNMTVPINPCSPPVYTWSVSYAATNCGTSITPIPNQTTTNASYNFIEAGTYTITLIATNSCTPAQTTTRVVTVKRPPILTSINGISPSYCGSAAINPTATVIPCSTSGTLTYAWSFPGGTPSSSTSPTPGPISYPAGGPYTVSLVVSNECGPSNTATQTFTVNIAPVITNTSLSQTICSGSTTTLVNLTANPTGTTFSWTTTATAGISGFTPSGTTNTIPVQTITTTNTSPGTVTYVITPSVGGCPGTPVNYVITVNPAPTISTQPASSSVCLGGTPTPLTVALNTSSVTPTYQWYSNTSLSTSGATLIPGASNATYNPPATSAGTLYYYCIISLSSGGCSGLTSAIATVTINPLPTITIQPLATQNICVGGSISAFTVAYTGGLGTATYQWYSNTSNATTGGTPVGTNSASYTPAAFTSAGTYYYYVSISLSGNGCGTVTSTSAQIVVVADPVVTAQPLTTQTLCQNSAATALTVAASGGIGSFTYQWYSNGTASTTGATLITSAVSASYTPPTINVGIKYYYCIISQTNVGCSVTSSFAEVIVNASPTIQNQPASSTVCVGGVPTLLSLTYTNGVGTPTYQWYSNTTNSNIGGTLLPGETNPPFSPPASIVTVAGFDVTTAQLPNMAENVIMQ